MPIFTVSRTTFPKAGGTTIDGVNLVVVSAASGGADAKPAVHQMRSGDSNAAWTEGFLTLCSDITFGSNGLDGYRFNIKVRRPSDQQPIVNVTYTGVIFNTHQNVGDGLVTLLNATAPISNASYNGSVRELTVAGAADNLGDHIIEASLWLPRVLTNGQDVTIEQRHLCPSSGFWNTYVHQGAAGASLRVSLPGDPQILPRILGSGTLIA